ncbi:MAG: prepilin peptidase [Ilumatobacteraceae bacterium]|nr:prepilin peptidase [Ilumatobacteraceae bacterium]
MTTIETLRVTPARTTDRVVAAWAAAHAVLRRAVVAAWVTSAALSTAVPAPTTVRWSIAAVGVVLAIAAMIDVREHKLPNRLLLGALAAVVAGVLTASSVAVVASATIGMLLGGGLMLLVQLTRGVGMGDVKMAGVVGATVGAVEINAAPVAIAVAAFAAAAYGLITRRQRVPIGPALWLGWAVSLAACAAGWLS